MKAHGLAAGLFLLLSALMLWPLPRLISRAVAHPSDPFVNTWVYDWAWHATTHRGVSLFDANALHPDGPSLAFTEHQFGIALFGFPFRAAGAAPLLTHNLLLLLGFAFSGYGAFVLARTVTGSWWAGVISGVFFAFLPWRFTHLTHTQHAWAGWLPLLLAALIAFARTPSWRRALLFGAAFFMNGITNLHWMTFGSAAIALAALLFLIRRPKALAMIAATTIVATLLLIPFLLPYREVRQKYGLRGNAEETRRYSAVPRDWITGNFHNRLHMEWKLYDATTDPERWLFPGVGGLLLALVGLIGPIKSSSRRVVESSRGAGLDDLTTRRLVLLVAAVWLLLGFLGSLGLNFAFHRLLFEHLELFRGIRAPARWAMIAYTGLALLAGIGAFKIVRHRHVVGAIVAALLVYELRSAPLQFHLIDTDEPPVYRWLAQQKGGAILELPIRRNGSEYEYFLRSTIHHRRMVNGVSEVGMHGELVDAFARRPIDLSIVDTLARIGVTTIVVHNDWIVGDEAAAVRDLLYRAHDAGKLRFVSRFDRGAEGDFVFALGKGDTKPYFGPQPLTRPIGWLDEPQPGAEVRGLVRVMGWAIAPAPIKRVRVFVKNREQFVDAQLFPRPDVGALYPWHDASRSGFTVDIPRGRREGGTDIEVEITDATGTTVRLPQRWFVWSR